MSVCSIFDLEGQKVNKSENIGDLAAALAAAQGEILNAKKDSKNPFIGNKYASLTAIWDAIRAPLSKHGLAVVQTTDLVDGQLYVYTTVMHSSGQWVTSRLPVHAAKQEKGVGWVRADNDLQALGSALTYAQRYGLRAMIGIPAEDDDGEAAVGRGKAGGKAEHGETREVVPDEPVELPAASLDEILGAAKKQWSGKGYSAARVRTHLDAIARGLGADSLGKISFELVPAVIDAIRNGSEPT